MKISELCMMAAIVGLWVATAQAATTSNVVAAQVPGTKQVLITYDVSSDVTNLVTVSVAVSNAAGVVSATHFSGHVGPGVPVGTGRQIVWDGGTDQDGQNLSGLRVWVNASAGDGGNGGDYLVVDLSGGTGAQSYPVSYLSAVPAGGWTDEHKTTKLVLRRIPAGTFTMGSPEDELGRQSSETQHQVTLTQDFYIGVFEVTQRQWELVMGNRPSYFNNATYYQTRPVEQVSYYEIRENPANSDDPAVDWPANSAVNATAFMGRLRVKTGLESFDLPTESQWEYACRAGTTTALNSGKNLTVFNCPNMSEVGRYWYNGGSSYSQGCEPSAATALAGSYLPNAWGLYDMHGNVIEWCLDWYGTYPGSVHDPFGAASGSARVLRGGSWFAYDGVLYCRSASRSNCDPAYRNYFNVGFRAARTLP